MDELPIELNVITLNCWGRKYTSSYREDRLTAIGRYLATTEPVPHIVALQECFEYDDYLSIRRETRFALPFGKFYRSGAFNCGLVILSRWPIEESSMVPFSLSGRPTGVFSGGTFMRTQGVACARIRFGEGEEDIVEVFNTHSDDDDNGHDVHRLSQAWEIAKLARNAAERGHLAVVLADLNSVPLSLPYRLLTSHAAIRDAWRVINPDSSLGPTSHELERARARPIPTASFNITENGVTSNSTYNTWSWKRSEQRALRSGKRPMLISPDTPDEDGQRVDYIFFSRGGDPHAFPTDLSEILSAHNAHTDDGTGVLPPPPGWVVKDVHVGLMARHPDLGCSLSDRFSVEATLVLHTPSPLRSRRRRHRSRSRSRSPSNSRGPSATLRDEGITSPKKSDTPATQSQQTSRGTPTPNTARDLSDATTAATGRRGNKENERGRRLVSQHSFTSTTDAGVHTLGERATAMEKGTYLQSPTASSYRRGSRDRAAWDLQLSNPDLDSPPRLPLAAYDEIVHQIDEHVLRVRRRQQLAIAHSVVWLIVLVASWVGVWFLPGGKGAFALLVVGSIGSAAGLASLLLALLSHAAELNRLDEFEWEIRNAKAVISGMPPDALVHQGCDEDKMW